MQYSIILQNTVDKTIYTYTTENTGDDSSIYYSFDIDVSTLPDGEYKLFLINNPSSLPIVINQNNVKESTISTNKYILICKTNILLNKDNILLVSSDTEYQEPIDIICTELVRIGNYTSNSTSYNKSQNFIQYGKQ